MIKSAGRQYSGTAVDRLRGCNYCSFAVIGNWLLQRHNDVIVKQGVMRASAVLPALSLSSCAAWSRCVAAQHSG